VPDSRVKVFVSYAREDKKHLERFLDQTSSLSEDGIDIFADTEIQVGDRWRERLFVHLDAADIFVALLTARYIKSKFCQDELKRALYRQSERGYVVFRVNLGPVNLAARHPLRDIQYIPEGRAISQRGNGQEAAWAAVAKELHETADRLRREMPHQLSSTCEHDETIADEVGNELSAGETPANVASLDEYRHDRDQGTPVMRHQRVDDNITEPRTYANLRMFIDALGAVRFDSSDWRTMSSRTSRLRKEIARLRANNLELPRE
jgi:maltooligosyltrehalose synthase